MSNRIAWLAVAVVVVVVGLLVFRSLRSGSPAETVASRTESPGGLQDRPSPTPEARDDSLPRNPKENEQSGVERVQTALRERGFYHGPVDGGYTPDLAAAIKGFQKANGMAETGYLNQKLYTALGLKLARPRSR